MRKVGRPTQHNVEKWSKMQKSLLFLKHMKGDVYIHSIKKSKDHICGK